MRSALRHLSVLTVLFATFPTAAHDDKSLGKIAFQVSCNAEAKRHFEDGLLLQYNYHWIPARKAFEAAAIADPKCGMAYFGVAVTHMDNILAGAPNAKQLSEGLAAVENARIAGLPTARERDFVAAVGVFFKGDEKQPGPARMEAFSREMERVSKAYPQDADAAVFHAWSLLGSASLTDQTYSKQLQAAAILEKVARDQPNHPGAVHFLVHAYDYPALAKDGVPFARRYSKLAAAAPHALHMPSHIFTRMGYWQDSVDSNAASAKSCDTDRCKLHAYDYMAYAYIQLGKIDEATKIVDKVREYGGKAAEDGFVGAYALSAAPLRLELEQARWKQAAAITVPGQTPASWAKVLPAEMILAFGRGLGAARGGDIAQARVELVRLANIEDQLRKKGVVYWAGQASIHMMSIEAWMVKAEGRPEDALRMMRTAADAEDKTEKHIVTPGPLVPVREMLGELLLETGNAAGAYQEFTKTLLREPNRRRSVQGAATAAERAGDSQNAKRYRDMLAVVTPTVTQAAAVEEQDPCPCRACRQG